jgi:outer membrane biosynthesis protein TonB
MRIRINLTEAKKPVDPKKVAADKKAEAKKADAKKVADKKKAEDKKKVEDKKKADAKKKLKESLRPLVKAMLAENFTDLSQDEKGLGNVIKGISMDEDTLNEIDPGSIDWSVVAGALGAIGLAPLVIDKIHSLWKKKFPESFKKAQGVSGAMDRQVGGNAPGDKDRQIKPGQF